MADPHVKATGKHSESMGSKAGSWEIIEAVLGRGTFLVGPSPRHPSGEAFVLAPPGVRISAPATAEQPVSTGGWRVALWAADDDGNRHVDVGRPLWISSVSLSYVIAVVELECPEHLSWVADRLEQRLINACIAGIPDVAGVTQPVADRWRQDAEATLEELDIALSSDQRPESLQPTGAGSVLPELITSAPIHPEVREPRLAPGRLRSFYGDLKQEIAAETSGTEKRH